MSTEIKCEVVEQAKCYFWFGDECLLLVGHYEAKKTETRTEK